jgi:hypothetical protein
MNHAGTVITWVLLIACFLVLVSLLAKVDNLRGDMAQVLKAQESLNKKYSVEYHYDPPPSWMRR